MSLLIPLVLVFLGVALLLYVLFGGADFGAGILELTFGRKASGYDSERKLISHAMAPVWEANHVWLILAVVILFMGFPEIYTRITTYLYIPLMAILVGVVARGCAFTFRYYDTLGQRFYRTYSLIFALSSVWTSFFLGVTAAAWMLGRIAPDAPDYWSAYVTPWANVFCVSVGLFTCALFACIAAIYLVGEAKTEKTRATFLRRAKIGNLGVVVLGALVFLSAELDGLSLVHAFFTNQLSVGFFVVASLLWIPFWRILRRPHKTVVLRVLASAITSAVLFGWFAIEGRGGVSFAAAAAPEATLKALLWALVFGSTLIFPALFYLFKVFKWETIEHAE